MLQVINFPEKAANSIEDLRKDRLGFCVGSALLVNECMALVFDLTEMKTAFTIHRVG